MSQKPSRNEPCTCGSGKKFKKCCGAPQANEQVGEQGIWPISILTELALSRETRPLPTTAKWLTDSRLPCPCGSGVEYRSCCETVIKEHDEPRSLLRETSEKLKGGDLTQAERLSRAHFVQYLGWVHGHTLPFLDSREPFIKKLVEIDTAALIENIESVAHYKAKLGHASEIIPFIDHAGSLIPFAGFDKHLTYLRAIWLYLGLDDREGARNELRKLGDILLYGRREALELYLDVFGTEMSEREMITIAENIVARADEDVSVRVQYTAIRSIAMMQIGEAEEGIKALIAVLNDVEAPAAVGTSDQLSLAWQLGKAWGFVGKVTDDTPALQKAEGLYRVIPEAMLTADGVASLQLELGWLLRDQERFEDAVAAYRRSQLLSPAEVTQIHLAHAFALSGELQESQDLLQEIKAHYIDDRLNLEYFAAAGALAIAKDDSRLVLETISEIRKIQSATPFWDAQKSHLIIELLDFANKPESTSRPNRQRRIMALLLSVNEMLELKPNFFGLGVNLNKMIEKIAKRLEKP
jgi:tetratricopeptide (TPR) repeat protein